jgi:signal transduction histidine kinase
VLDKITQQSFRASEIANGLLNFSRTSTTEFRETNLNQVIRDTLSLLEHQFKTAQIRRGCRPDRRIACHSRQPRQAAAGLSQPAAERQGSHARPAAGCA